MAEQRRTDGLGVEGEGWGVLARGGRSGRRAEPRKGQRRGSKAAARDRRTCRRRRARPEGARARASAQARGGLREEEDAAGGVRSCGGGHARRASAVAVVTVTSRGALGGGRRRRAGSTRRWRVGGGGVVMEARGFDDGYTRGCGSDGLLEGVPAPTRGARGGPRRRSTAAIQEVVSPTRGLENPTLGSNGARGLADMDGWGLVIAGVASTMVKVAKWRCRGATEHHLRRSEGCELVLVASGVDWMNNSDDDSSDEELGDDEGVEAPARQGERVAFAGVVAGGGLLARKGAGGRGPEVVPTAAQRIVARRRTATRSSSG